MKKNIKDCIYLGALGCIWLGGLVEAYARGRNKGISECTNILNASIATHEAMMEKYENKEES